MALSFVMGALLGFIGFVLMMMFYYDWGPPSAGTVLIMVAIIFFLSFSIYSYLYPLLKRFVIFHGLQELNTFTLSEYNLLSRRIRNRFFLRLIKISLKRYSFQTLAFLVLLLPPTIEMMFNQKGLYIVILFSLVSLWPLAMSYYNYFFAELSTIDEMIREVNPDYVLSANPTLPKRKLFWLLVNWKAILLVVYITLLFAFSFAWGYIATFTDSVLKVNGYVSFFRDCFSFLAYSLTESISPLLAVNFLILFIVLQSEYLIWILLFFLLLFGLLTAFFFLVETLSTVYFYHRCRGIARKIK
jgi:hypothetical protein